MTIFLAGRQASRRNGQTRLCVHGSLPWHARVLTHHVKDLWLHYCQWVSCFYPMTIWMRAVRFSCTVSQDRFSVSCHFRLTFAWMASPHHRESNHSTSSSPASLSSSSTSKRHHTAREQALRRNAASVPELIDKEIVRVLLGEKRLLPCLQHSLRPSILYVWCQGIISS